MDVLRRRSRITPEFSSLLSTGLFESKLRGKIYFLPLPDIIAPFLVLTPKIFVVLIRGRTFTRVFTLSTMVPGETEPTNIGSVEVKR